MTRADPPVSTRQRRHLLWTTRGIGAALLAGAVALLLWRSM